MSDAAAGESSLPFVQLFTDGACSGNPGPGGWAYILKHPASRKVVEASGGDSSTTNNRMELQAVIGCFQALKSRSSVEIVTDPESQPPPPPHCHPSPPTTSPTL